MGDTNYNVSIKIGAIDKASGIISSIGSAIDKSKYYILGATAAIGAFAYKAVSEAMEAEKAQLMLASAMKQAGTFTMEAYNKNLAYAASLQKTTTYTDEQVMSIQKQLTFYKLQGEQLSKATNATLDMASAGFDANTAALMIGKTVNSQVNAFARYGIEVKGATGSTERFTSVMQGLSKYQGASAAEAQTVAGRMKQLNNTVNEVYETIGLKMLPILLYFANMIKNNLMPSLQSAANNTDTLNIVFNGIIKTIEWMVKGIYGIIYAFQNMGTVISTMAAATSQALSLNFTGAINTIATGMDGLTNNIMMQGERIKGINFGTTSKMQLDYTTTYNNIIAQTNAEAVIFDNAENSKQEKFMKFCEDVGNSYAGTINEMMQGTMNMKDGFNTIFTQMGNYFTSMVAKMIAKWMAFLAIKGVLSLFGGGLADKGVGLLGKIFGFAGGVTNFSGGYAMVGEQGAELVSLPRGSNVYSNKESKGMLAGGGISLVVNVTGNSVVGYNSINEFSDLISEQILRKLRYEVSI